MKHLKLLLVIFSVILVSKSFADTFYNTSTIQTIKIVFSETNWDYKLDTAKAGSESYLMAKSVTINGIQYDSVGVKYKGNSTYNANQTKNPFHIELDTYKDQDYEGYTDIKLSNVANDPSFVREVLSYSILRNYMEAPQSNYANVYVNGTLIGLYVSSEAIGKKFVKKYFNSKSNAFFKCNPIDGANTSTPTSSLPNLLYLGTDSASYAAAYEMNSDYGWSDLINLTNTLSNDITNIETILDVDRALWMLAFDNVTVNLDSYIGQFAQNYYLYKADNGRFNCILWDFNEGFGKFSMSGTTTFNSTSSKSQMSHTLHSSDTNWPLVKKLLAVATYKKRYIAHMLTILEDNFSGTSYKTTAQAYQSTISSSVSADPNKFYTFSQFSSNLTTDVTSGNSTAPGITALMSARYTYLTGLTDFKYTKPAISSITVSNSTPYRYSSVYVTANITNTTSSSVYLYYRYSSDGIFTKLVMYDDGAHGDGTAGDNVYGASVYLSNVTTQYYIYAENTNAGTFSPARAEHEFYTITANTVASNIVMNEIYSRGTTSDPDWIEIYNNSTSSIDLSGYTVYDSGGYSGTKAKKEIPSGTTIEAKGFYVIVTDDALTSGFGLSNSGEKVWLANQSGTVIDSVTYEAHTDANSYGRLPDGGTWGLTTSVTREYSNNGTTAVKEISASSIELGLKCYPNPFTNSTTIQFTLPNQGKVSLTIYNSFGELVKTLEDNTLYSGTHTYQLDAAKLTSGIYIYKLQVDNKVATNKIVLFK